MHGFREVRNSWNMGHGEASYGEKWSLFLREVEIAGTTYMV